MGEHSQLILNLAARYARDTRHEGAPPIPARERLARARAHYAEGLFTDGQGFVDLDPIGPFSIHVQVHPDEWFDDGWGEFVDESEDGVTVESPRRFAPSAFQTAAYYRPGWSIADRFDYWRSMGADRSTARRWAIMGAEDEARAAAEAEPCGVTVTATMNGREYGRAGLWGIDGNADNASAYLMTTATELAEEAVADAWQNIEREYGANGRQLFLLVDA